MRISRHSARVQPSGCLLPNCRDIGPDLLDVTRSCAMDETTSGVDLLFDEDRALGENSNVVTGAAIWSLVLVEALLVGLFGGYTLTWCLIGMFDIAVSIYAVLIWRLIRDELLHA